MQELAALIHKAAGGDEAAFSAFVRLTEKTVWRYVYHLVKNSEDAYDVSQETYLKLWKSLRQYRGDCTPTTWLLRIAQSCAVDFLRGKSKRIALPLTTQDKDGEEMTLDTPDPDIAASPEASFAQKQAREAIREAVSQLPEEQRDIIVLRDFDGRAYEEIAAILGIELGTVKSRLSRARNAIKKILIARNFF